jgi:peptide/nickel transport system substrate-binding protein
MFSVLRTGDFSNYGQWSNKDYDKAVNAGLQTMDGAERFTKSLEPQKILNQELPWLPLYESPTVMWMNDRVTGASPSLNFLYFPWAAKIGKR